MITSARRLSLSVMLTALPATVPLTAHALTLGGLANRSSQGQPLDASVELYLAPHERALPMVVTVTPDLFAGNRVSMQSVLDGVTARVEHAPGGHSYIHLRSAAPIAESTLNFRLRVAQAERGLSRNYALTLPAPRLVPTLSPARRTAARTGQARASIAGTDYTVRSGDSLWTIAKRWQGPGNINQRMQALHAANPDAFVGGDIDKLKVGAHLQLPGSEEVAAAPVAATTEVTIDPATGSDRASTPIALPAARPEEDPFAATADADDVTTPPLRGRDPVLAARLAELDAKFAAIRARYAPDATSAIVTETPAPAAAEALPATAPVVADPTPAEIAPVVTAAEESAEVVVPPAASAVANAAPATVAAAPVATGRPYLVVGPLLGLAGGLALFVFLRRRRHTQEQLQSAFQANEAARKAAVAAKLAGRHGGDSQAGVLDTGRLSAVELESLPDFAATLDGLEPEPKVVPLVRSLEETQDDIDASIAHGRYQDAERLLLQVIAGAPRNVAAKLRLAEVYYITERVEEFIALAEDLQQNHRGEMGNEEWRRVMRMGKIIAPDRPLFAGPRAVNQG